MAAATAAVVVVVVVAMAVGEKEGRRPPKPRGSCDGRARVETSNPRMMRGGKRGGEGEEEIVGDWQFSGDRDTGTRYG